MWLVAPTYLALTFLIAAVPTGLVLTALTTDVDIRSAGSGNIGATNVYRLTGRLPGLATLAGDALKGFLPVLLSHWVLGGGPWGVSATLLAAFAGHCYSPYLAFRGGKGVATAMGGFLAAAPLAAAIAAGIWIGVVAHTRRSSLAALAGLAGLWLALGLLPWARVYLPVSLVVGALMIARHRDNWRRLLAGTEARV